MADEIINRVENSKLMTFDLEEIYPEGKRTVLDIKDWLFEELILKEKDFRSSVKNHNWSQYKNSFVAVTCSVDAIIPSWAFLLVSAELIPFAKKVVIGDLTKYGVPLSKQHPVVQLRETGKTPVIDLGTVAHIKKGKIKIVGKIDQFYKKGVMFESGEKHEFDSIILATGYRARIEEFLENGKEFLDKYEVPKQPIGEGKFKGLYFVGFDNYKLGGILGTVFNDSKTIVDDILKS